MRLYVMRHGPAEPRGRGIVDADRSLTEAGREQTQAAARGLKRLLGSGAVQLRTSPLARARETADLVAAELAPEGGVVTDDAFSSGAVPGEMLKSLRAIEADTLIVGHDPDLSALFSYLLDGETRLFLDLAKGGVVALEFATTPTKASGKLLWYLRRAHLALLGEAPSASAQEAPTAPAAEAGQPRPVRRQKSSRKGERPARKPASRTRRKGEGSGPENTGGS